MTDERERPCVLAHTTYLLHQAGEVLTRGAVVQGLDVVQEALGPLDFSQELIHVPAARDLGMVGAVSHHSVPHAAQAGRGKEPCHLLKVTGRL